MIVNVNFEKQKMAIVFIGDRNDSPSNQVNYFKILRLKYRRMSPNEDIEGKAS
jgi:hypothetical protein